MSARALSIVGHTMTQQKKGFPIEKTDRFSFSTEVFCVHSKKQTATKKKPSHK
jgi:hypothetical protein